MIQKHKSIRTAVLLLACAAFIAWGDTWDRIKSAAGSISSVEADFVQEKHMEILSRPMVSKGKLYFQGGGSLRWEYTAPVASVLLAHGSSITRYVKKGDGYTKDSGVRLQSMRIVLQEISLWMKGSFDANPAFAPELRPGRVIVLTPKEKSMANIIQKIEMRLSDTPGIIRSVTIYESGKSYTRIEFKNVKLNVKIPESLFRKL